MMTAQNPTELENLKYEYGRALRARDNLQKNLERRKKLKLCDTSYEREILADIERVDEELKDMRKRIHAVESQQIRSQNVAESHENGDLLLR